MIRTATHAWLGFFDTPRDRKGIPEEKLAEKPPLLQKNSARC